MEVKCGLCGHTMEIINYDIKKASNGRLYFDILFECIFTDCPNKGYKIYIQDFLVGFNTEDSDVSIHQIGYMNTGNQNEKDSNQN